ncbi:hypothetical protein CC86DRAFT_388225 [Ophiobolus disseminans]|uniref:Uncharacterized protein n=1 Tax=Ophiobolus disseminans TaxID=1469910 RepID=A0A6A6ZGK3_9PLEO|nr:hypothetical protein CC86DRAFT_388225 [Ophiobolus disseminans]
MANTPSEIYDVVYCERDFGATNPYTLPIYYANPASIAHHNAILDCDPADRLDIFPVTKSTRFSPGNNELAIFLMQVQRGPPTPANPKGVQQVSVTGWTDSFHEANKLMLHDAEIWTRCGPGMAAVMWRWADHQNGLAGNGTICPFGISRTLKYEIHKVEMIS